LIDPMRFRQCRTSRCRENDGYQRNPFHSMTPQPSRPSAHPNGRGVDQRHKTEIVPQCHFREVKSCAGERKDGARARLIATPKRGTFKPSPRGVSSDDAIGDVFGKR
jgi:hypothetical protein